jgi:hypothetical protein
VTSYRQVAKYRRGHADEFTMSSSPTVHGESFSETLLTTVFKDIEVDESVQLNFFE